MVGFGGGWGVGGWEYCPVDKPRIRARDMMYTGKFSVQRVRSFLADAEERLASDEAERMSPTKDKPYKVHGLVEWKVTSAWDASVCHLLLGDPASSRRHAESMPARVEHYFYGSWRFLEDEWDRDIQQFVPWGTEERCRERLSWIQPYRYGLAASLAVGDLRAAGRVAEYSYGTRLRDIGYTAGPENTPEAVDAYEAYADLLLGKPLRLLATWEQTGRKRTKRVQILGRVFSALAGGDAASAAAGLDEFIVYYGRSEREMELGEISPDITILDYLVRRAGGSGASPDGTPRKYVLQWDKPPAPLKDGTRLRP